MLRVAEEFHGSHTGRQRRANEDSVYARAPLFAVADGMGGAQAGEIASRVAIETLGEARVPEGAAEQRLAEIVLEANDRIHALSRQDQSRAGMGTTLTVLLVGDDEVTIAHVGDSRAYRYRGGGLERLTDDHSLVEELRRQGRLTEEEADEHPQRSIITRALGPEGHVEVDTRTWPARDGDVFLVCSDGLTTMLKEEAIAETLRSTPSLRDAGERLIDAANDAGGRDNISVVLVRVGAVDGGARDARGEQATSAGDEALRTGDVHAALEAEERGGATATVARDDPTPSRRLEPIRPRAGAAPPPPEPPPAPPPAKPPRRRRRRRALAALAVAAVLLVPIGIGVLTALRAVYFVGADEQGYVAVYRGVPWELPLGLDLYQTNYTSGVHRDLVPAARRETLLDHSLRSRDDAYEVVAELERGRLEAP
ncbi:MAG TPA: Stp1/IreP family PP2C-type Ser/Thr phosphatase [Solirubrobacteraceae bacterium]|jgi:protein phosphatase|nr:Stp1/IreP family PP2C-type Ser/Thr phosphatase [Solirubrobacteraceae bacterium]